MKTYKLLHFGIGTVGKEFVKQLQEIQKSLETNFDISLSYVGFFTSRGGVVIPDGFSDKEFEQLTKQFDSRVDPHTLQGHYYVDPMALFDNLGDEFFANTIIIDTTISSAMYPFVYKAMQMGASVVAANKRLLTGSIEEFNKLNSFGPKRLMHETTVGAGLPVINTLKTLLATGDDVIEISGCMSGTLGFICSSLEEGKKFSESVKKAKALGYTETDPRADLSGQDVARKALILARLLGQTKEMLDVPIEAWYPITLADISVDEFMNRISELDKMYFSKMEKAQAEGNTLRYVAKVIKKDCIVSLQEVSKQSSLGALKGADNIFVFKTKRYIERPLVVQGPGAGPDVTAAGVMGDVLSIVGVI